MLVPRKVERRTILVSGFVGQQRRCHLVVVIAWTSTTLCVKNTVHVGEVFTEQI
jgi:hypothetical protein